MSCSRRMRRVFCFWAARRKRMAAQVTTLKRRRLSRWMMIGHRHRAGADGQRRSHRPKKANRARESAISSGFATKSRYVRSRQAVRQVTRQRHAQRRVGPQLHVIDVLVAAAVLQLVDERFDLFQVALRAASADRSAVRDIAPGRGTASPPGRETSARRRPGCARGRPRAACGAGASSPARMSGTSSNMSLRRKTSARRLMRSARSWKIGAMLRLLAPAALVHDVDDLLEVRRLARRLQEAADLVVEGHEADAVGLVQDQVGQGGGRHAGVVVLASPVREP